ncbi:MAG: aminotransferase class V-fold PLP-dependent enzyme, partial [Candidatus Thorarchaeota archaeon]|nr:aminotransferase class V-fold PLP-dependent enzyme [Candidatus Thorarchaeota archaeon]
MTAFIDPDFISEMWPTLKDMTYLNNASTGIPPVTTINAMKEYLDNRVRAAGGSFKETLSNIKAIRTNLAHLLGGDYDQYALIPSTSSGINSFAHSIDYPEGSNIVLCDLEFPANYVPWQNVKKLYGAELRVVKSINGGVPIERFGEV